MIKLKILL